MINPTYLIAAGAAILGFAAGSVAPFAQTEQTEQTAETPPASRAEVEDIIRNFLMENPEVILQAVQSYSNRQEEEQAAERVAKAGARLDDLKAVKNAYGTGPDASAAKVTVIEFADYTCSACRNAAPGVQRVMAERGDVRFVFREYPILTRLRPNAAVALLAADAQGKSEVFQRELASLPRVATDDEIEAAARAAGLDMDAFRTASRDENLMSQAQNMFPQVSSEAGRAALAARGQGKYVDFHFALMNASGRLTSERIDAIAEEVGIDVPAMRAAMNTPEIDAAINDTFALARDIGVNSTPSFVVIGDGFIDVMAGWNEGRFRQLLAEAG